jgi:serine/threonine-protein kinase ULK/ATG1
VDLESVPFQIKIADLGFAKTVQSCSEKNTTYCGTPINMAPEVLNREDYNIKADIWSLGTVTYELMVGHSPFRDAKTKS